MLPASKAVPKEMFPIVDKPLIQYAVEEAVASGIEHIVFVIAEGREAVVEHFALDSRVERVAHERGNTALAEQVSAPARLARFDFVRQDEPRGIADAVRQARPLVDGEPFALMFPDDLILGERPCLAQLIEAYEACGGSVIAVREVPREQIHQYGIVDPAGASNPIPLRGVIEKPSPEAAPSNLGIVGRYVVSPTIFEHIDSLQPGAGGELQFTDALASQIAAGEPVCACAYEGRRYDAGRPAGGVAAAVAAALDRPDVREALLEQLRPLLAEEGV